MPGKLAAVVGLIGIGVVANLATSALISAAFGAALLVGVLAGNDGVRTFLRGLAAIQILWTLTLLVAASNEKHADSTTLLVLGAFGIGVPAFYLWALGQQDVRDWMFRKNFNLDDQPPTL